MNDVMLTQRAKEGKLINRIKIVLAICGILLLVCAVFLFMNRAEIGARYRVRELLSEVASASGSSLQLNSVDIDDKKKTLEITYIDNRFRSVEDCNAARVAINEYLEKKRDFFLNNGYLIQLTIKDRSNGPIIMIISNQNYYANALYDELSCIAIESSGASIYGSISSYKNWADIQTLRIWSANMDDISALSQFAELEYISKHDGFTIYETQAIEQMLPNCKIVSY